MAYCNIKEKKINILVTHTTQMLYKMYWGLKIKLKTLFTLYPFRMNLLLPKDGKNIQNILQAIARVIHLLGKQDLALRGHQEDISDISSNSENPGNCLTLLQQIALCNPISAKHSSQKKCYFFRSCRKMN